MRIALVSDTHLSARSPECVANWHAARRAIQRLDVDLTVHLGEVTLGGPFSADEFRLAAWLIGQWPTEMRCLTGSRDFGDASRQTDSPDPWQRACRLSFGSDHWVLRAGGWRLLGFNAQILGTGSAREQSLLRLLDDEDGALDTQPRTAVFVHWPSACGGQLAPSAASAGQAASRAYAGLIGGPLKASLQLVVSGHRAPSIDFAATGVRQLRLPPTVHIGPDFNRHRIGEKLVGVGLLELGRDEVGFDLWCPDGLTRHHGSKLPLGRASGDAVVARSTDRQPSVAS
jgi:hypothetical protein